MEGESSYFIKILMLCLLSSISSFSCDFSDSIWPPPDEPIFRKIIYFDDIKYSNDTSEVIVYDDDFELGSSGLMGPDNGSSLSPTIVCEETSYSGRASFKVIYDKNNEEWAGIYILANGSWIDKPTQKLKDMKTLSFSARCYEGTVLMREMGMGIEYDPFGKNSIQRTLTTDWETFTMDLTGKDLSEVIGVFYFSINKTDNPLN